MHLGLTSLWMEAPPWGNGKGLCYPSLLWFSLLCLQRYSSTWSTIHISIRLQMTFPVWSYMHLPTKVNLALKKRKSLMRWKMTWQLGHLTIELSSSIKAFLLPALLPLTMQTGLKAHGMSHLLGRNPKPRSFKMIRESWTAMPKTMFSFQEFIITKSSVWLERKKLQPSKATPSSITRCPTWQIWTGCCIQIFPMMPSYVNWSR